MHIEPFQKRLKILLTIFPALATAEVLFMILNLRDHQYHEKCEFRFSMNMGKLDQMRSDASVGSLF